MRKIHWGAALSFLATLGSVVASPLITGLVPAKVAAVLIGISSVAQAVTKAIQSVSAPETPQ